ncbi:MAG: HAD family hydrolase [Hyphomicrobiales bacterium]
MDDVLCAYHVDIRIAALAEITGKAADSIRASIWETDFLEQSDRGAYSAQAYLEEFGRRLDYPLSRAEWVAARKAAMPPFHDVLRLVRRVKKRLPVALLTNNDHLLGDTLDEIFPDLIPLFGDAIFVSARIGAAKPDSACFVHCCTALNVTAMETFFTDDLVENVLGARNAGLIAHHFDGYRGLVQALEGRGIRTD